MSIKTAGATGNADSGVQAIIASDDIGAGVFVDVEASGNTGRGLDIDGSFAGPISALFLSGIEANENTSQGIRIQAESTDQMVLWLDDVHAHQNDLQGIRANIEADEDLLVIASDVHASYNRRHGLWLTGDAGGEAYFVMAPDPVEVLDGTGPGGITIVQPDSTPGGPSSFINNGWDTDNPGARAGLRVELDATGDIVALLEGEAEFLGNTGNGLHWILNSQEGDIEASISDATAADNDLQGIVVAADAADGDIEMNLSEISATGNTRHGVLLRADAEDGDIDAVLDNVTANDNDLNGIRAILDNSPNPNDVSLTISNSEALNNLQTDLFGRLRFTAGGSASSTLIDNTIGTDDVLLQQQ